MQLSMTWQIARGKTRSSEGKIFVKNIEVDNMYKITSRGTNSKQKGKKLVQVMTLKTPKA
jgi:hypothetical protein